MFSRAFVRRSTIGFLGTAAMAVACDGNAPLPDVIIDQDGDGSPFGTDCNDRDATIFPGAEEIPDDGIDQDCDGQDLISGSGGVGGGSGGSRNGAMGGSSGSGTGGETSVPLEGDRDGDGFVGFPEGDDCDDTRAFVFPGAVEIVLNGIDENCDGSDLVGQMEGVRPFSEDAAIGEVPDMALSFVDGAPRLLAVWADSRATDRQDLYGQLFDLEGNRVGEEIALEDVDNAAKQHVRLASKGDGFLVTWVTADGVFARQLKADGTLRDTVRTTPLGISGPGGQRPIASYGGTSEVEGGAWAIAWTQPGEPPGNQAKIRTLSTAREPVLVPIRDLGGAADEISAVGLVGNEDGFVAVWTGSNLRDSGVFAQKRTWEGLSDGGAFPIYRGDASGPTIAYDGDTYFAVFRTGGPFGFAGGLRFTSPDEGLDPSAVIRLSAESLGQRNFRVTSTLDGFFALWDDNRHLAGTPAIQSVYGNSWNEANGTSIPLSRAYFAGLQSELGGVVQHEGRVYFIVRTGPTAELHSASARWSSRD